MAISSSQTTYLEGITVLTETGEWKVWHNGQLIPLEVNKNSAPFTQKASTDVVSFPLHSNPLMVKKDTAAFYFYAEDEEDVAKLVIPETGPKVEYSLTKIVEKILAHYSLTLAGNVLLNLKNILFVFLKGTRSQVGTWELLQAPVVTGGANLDISLADTILGFLKELKKKIEGAKGEVVDDWGTKAENLANVPPVVQNQFRPAPAAPVKPESAATQSNHAIKPRKALDWQDQKMGDVRRSYKLVSPMEELVLINLEMLRKMGETQNAFKKIKEKIMVLGAESIGQGSQAIAAWRKSPLNQMYIKIGQLSLNSGQDVSQVINQLTEQGEHVLTLAEFEAISDLNHSLRA